MQRRSLFPIRKSTLTCCKTLTLLLFLHLTLIVLFVGDFLDLLYATRQKNRPAPVDLIAKQTRDFHHQELFSPLTKNTYSRGQLSDRLDFDIFSRSVTNQPTEFKSKKRKSILIWNTPERIETSAFGFGQEPFVRHGCPFSECVIFENTSGLSLEEFDAIIIHMHELYLTDLPHFQRSEHQRMIFFTQESPDSMQLDFTDLGNVFNWTMSYRLNSEVHLLYGRIEPMPTAPKTREQAAKLMALFRARPNKNYAKNKSNLAVWMASHCTTPSLREQYVGQLKKFIPVDVYGACGNLNCTRNDTHWLSDPKCYDMMEKKYKFYLSFENSICDDYVTEKFYEILKHDMIPIVYGGANYSRIAPAHSYIDALQYTPKKLAAYLKRLDANDTLYNEFFWWKKHYRVEAGVDQMVRHGFCDLCQKLHQHQDVTIKSYTDILSEWQPKRRCYQVASWED